MSKTYGRISGECWEKAYQKAEEIRVLQRHHEKNRFALSRVRQYLIVIAYQTGIVVLTRPRKIRFIVGFVALLGFVGSTVTIISWYEITPEKLSLIIQSNLILISYSMLAGILVKNVFDISLPRIRSISRDIFGNKELELKHQNLESNFLALKRKFSEFQIRYEEWDGTAKSLVRKANHNSDAAIRDFALSRVRKIRQYLRDGEYLFDYGEFNEVTKDRATLQGLALLDKSILMKRVEKSDDFLDVAYYAFFDNPSDIERIANDLESMANSLSDNG